MDLIFFSDIKAASETARKLKEKEITLAQHFNSEKELAELKQKAKRENLAIKFCHVLEKADALELKDFREKTDFLAVFGGNVAVNKFAASSKQIDFLLQPVGTQKLEFDSAIANTAKENGVAIAILFSDFLNASQYDRISLFRNYFLLAKICKRAKAELVVFSGARSMQEMRASMDLDSFLVLLYQKNFDEETG